MDKHIVINNPIDETKMFWVDNDFTKNNYPGPDFQKNQKKNSLKYILEKGKGVLDIGSHIGDFGIPLALALRNLKRTDIKVYCIDPSPEKCKFMKQMCQLNNLNETNIKIICTGISNNCGKYSITKHGKGGVARSKKTNNTGAWQWTPDPKGTSFTTLDKLYDEKTIDEIGFFWLDAQWMELNVLKGGKNYLTKHKPYILMEYWPIKEFEDDHVSVKVSRPGTKQQLLNDTNFVTIFNEYKIIISKKGQELDDILLEFL